jgi:hypothetical protein
MLTLTRPEPGPLRAPVDTTVPMSASRRRHWTPEEDAIVRALYPKSSRWKRLRASLPGRTWKAIGARAQRLGVPSPERFWTREENLTLAREWGDMTLCGLAKKLRRSILAVRQQAKALGLPFGIPQGCVSVHRAAVEAGYSDDVMLRILERAGVTLRQQDGPASGKRRHPRSRFADADAVRKAVDAWEQYIRETETASDAARRYGFPQHWAVHLLNSAGVRTGGRRRKIRVRIADVDRVLGPYVRGETIAGAARRLGVNRSTLHYWLHEEGLAPPVPPNRKRRRVRLPRELFDRVIEIRRASRCARKNNHDAFEPSESRRVVNG